MSKKSVIKNYIYNLIYQILVIILPVITIPYLARVLEPENIGINGYTTSIATYFVIFGTLGIAFYAQREIAYVQDSKRDKSKIFFEVVILRAITLLLAISVFCITFVNNGDYEIYYKILIIQLVANCFDITWFFQGQEEFKKVVIRNIAVKILSIVSIFIFVKTNQDLWKYMLIIVLSELIGNLSLWLYLPKYLIKVKIKELNIKKHVLPTIIFFIPQVAIQVYTVLDKVMLGMLTNNMNEIAYYEQSQKIIRLLLTVITALGTVMVPRIANEYINNNKEKINNYIKKSFVFTYFLSFPMIFGLIAVAENFIPIFLGNQYDKTIILLQISSIIILFIGMSSVIGVQYLIPTKQQKKYTISVLVAAIVNFLLNLILIPKYLSVGAIISTIVAELLVTVIQIYFIRKEMVIKDIFLSMKKYFLAGILMFFVVYMLKNVFMNSIYSLIIQVFIGGIVYLGILLIIKDEFILEAKDKLIKNVLKK